VLLAIGVIAALIFGLQVAAYATHYGVSLEGSKFEIEDSVDPDGTGPKNPLPPPPGANLKVDVAGNLDWLNVDEIFVTDAINGTGDNSFTEGSKEDTTDPVIEFDGIPPNKSDLRHFGVYLETNANGRFLHVYWHRVQDPSGTTNMDFEFNALVCGPDVNDVDDDNNTTEPNPETCSANGETPKRTAGDVLIQYDLASGGTNPELFLSKWVTSASALADPLIPDRASQACEANNASPAGAIGLTCQIPGTPPDRSTTSRSSTPPPPRLWTRLAT
jgi:hypothetical protein